MSRAIRFPQPAATATPLSGHPEKQSKDKAGKVSSRKTAALNEQFGNVSRILDLKAAENYSGLSRWTVRDLILAGHIARVIIPDVLHPGRNLARVLTTPEAIDAFIQEHMTAKDADKPSLTRGQE